MTAATLRVDELLGFNPTLSLDHEGKRVYQDLVAESVIKDFRDIILYHTPPTLRASFVSGAVPALDPGVQSIVRSDTRLAAFYGGLSVPLLAMAYGARRDSDDARLLNAARAEKILGLELQRNPLFVDQQDKLYRFRWASCCPRLNDYLEDQQGGGAAHAQEIDEERGQWEERTVAHYDEAHVPADDRERLQAMQHIAECVRRARRGRYWAFRLYLRLLEDVPRLLSPEALLAVAHNGDPAMAIKRNVMLLDMLDRDRFFSRAYVERTSAYNLCANLASRVDFHGNAEALADYAEAALTQYARDHEASADPEVRSLADLARQFVRPIDGRGEISPFHRLVREGLARSAATDYSAVMGDLVGRLTAPNLAQWMIDAGKLDHAKALLKGAFGGAALGLVMTGGIPYGQIPEKHRYAVALGISSTLVHSLPLLLRGTLHLPAFFSSQAARLTSLEATFAQWKAFDVDMTYSTGLSGWIVRNGGGKAGDHAMQFEQMRRWRAGGTTYDYGRHEATVSKIFGRNLNEFMAYRVGAVIAALNLYLAVWSLRDAVAPLDIASAAVSLAGASFMVIGSAGGWVVSAFGRFALAGEIAGLMSTLATVATVAVVVIVVVQMWMAPSTPSRLAEFAAAEAQAAGLYIPHGAAIDHFTTREPDIGLRLRDDAGRYLVLRADGSLALGAVADASILFQDTTGAGMTQLHTVDATAARALVDRENKVATADPRYQSSAAHCWLFDLTAGIVWGEGGAQAGRLDGACFTIRSATDDKKRYLAVQDGALALSAQPATWTAERAPRSKA